MYRLADTPLRNVVRHGSFDWAQWRGKLGPWQPTGAGQAKVIVGKPAGILHSYSERNSIIGAGVELSGEPKDGIEQSLDALRPNQLYEVSAWVKMKGKGTVRIGVRGAGQEPVEAATGDAAKWRLLTARFTASAKPGDVTVFVSKTGEGTAFADHVALTGVVAGIEPVKAGLFP